MCLCDYVLIWNELDCLCARIDIYNCISFMCKASCEYIWNLCTNLSILFLNLDLKKGSSRGGESVCLGEAVASCT